MQLVNSKGLQVQSGFSLRVLLMSAVIIHVFNY